MPEYYDPNVRPVQERPFTFQELLVIPSMYKESYEKSMKEYNDYADKAALIRSMAGESPTAQKAFAEYDNGVKGLSEAMLSGRWNPQMAAEAQNLREMYRNKIIPIGTAINNYQEDLKRFDALNKDGKAFGNTATLENYIQDPNYRGRFYSGSALQQEAMTAGALAANGITPQQLAEYYSNPSAPQFKGINDVVNRILAENGYNSLDDDTKKQMRGYVMNGLGMGLQASANKTYDEALKYQRDLNKIAYSHSFTNNNGGGGKGKNGKMQTNPNKKKGDLSIYLNARTDKAVEKFEFSDDLNNLIKSANAREGINKTIISPQLRNMFGNDYERAKKNKAFVNMMAMSGYNINSKKDYDEFIKNFPKTNSFEQTDYVYDISDEGAKNDLYDVLVSAGKGQVPILDRYIVGDDGFGRAKTKLKDIKLDKKDFAEHLVEFRINPYVKDDVKIVVYNVDDNHNNMVIHMLPKALGFNQESINKLGILSGYDAIVTRAGGIWPDELANEFITGINDFNSNIMTSRYFTETGRRNQNDATAAKQYNE